MIRSLSLAILMVSPSFATADGERARTTAADYRIESTRGWSVHVERILNDHPRQTEALVLLEKRLAEVERIVPDAALREVKKVPLWLSKNAAPGACYHPSAKWLEDNGRVVEMARSIEIQNIDHFIDWSAAQPMMILHELAHAWHHRVLDRGYQNPEILAAFQVAVDSGKYEKVRHADGRETKHYALSNAMEYFAECTEAYFGRNDFHPFDHEELLAFDSSGYRLIVKLWGIDRQ